MPSGAKATVLMPSQPRARLWAIDRSGTDQEPIRDTSGTDRGSAKPVQVGQIKSRGTRDAMNREETHALWAQGRDAWNAWAQEMLAEKARLEEAGVVTDD